MKDGPTEINPVGVREAKRRGDIQREWTFNSKDRWPWVEPCVWTERMLDALERGVKGGKWHSLIDKVYSEKNLRASFERVKRNKGRGRGSDHQRWPNAYFIEHGLFTLEYARERLCQSSPR